MILVSARHNTTVYVPDRTRYPGGLIAEQEIDAIGDIIRRANPIDRVEYVVTPFGTQFIRILDELEKLQQEIAADI